MALIDRSILLIGECMIELSPLQGGEFKSGFAGDTFNTAWYLRRKMRDAWNVGYFTAVGDDHWSAEMLRFFAGAGVDTRDVVTVAGRSPGLYIVRLEKGERSFSYWRSNSAARAMMDDKEQFERSLEGKGVIFFSGITLAILSPENRDRFIAALAQARLKGSLIAFDPNVRPHLWESSDVMRSTISKAGEVADIVLPSFEDEHTHFGDKSSEETIRRYATEPGKVIVVKNGGHEVVTQSSQGDLSFWAPAKVENPVDTTAAGDAFNAGFLASYLEDENIPDAVACGGALAAKVISKLGALVD
ncbi:sugar kinase [Thalassospira lucentensis]|uniref:sugar kinase n=1 Tax=Thalassospira lucentensis TaxID=168935 RepID=UPI003D2EF22B